MTTDMVITIAYQAVYTVLLVAAPMLAAGLMVGLSVGIFQAATSIHEMTLTFIPKILAVFLAMLIFLPWMLRTIIGFTISLYSMLPTVAQ
ncbi:flagellar biosynthesis protein FliQ [bacterium]|nr:flagellar biosynthesis protein FliQ [bacterium]